MQDQPAIEHGVSWLWWTPGLSYLKCFFINSFGFIYLHQGMFVAETWMCDIARTLSLPQDVVREANFYQEGDTTHYNQVLTQNTVVPRPRL